MLHRIYTEDINQENIKKIVNEYYPGYTLLVGTGYWQGKPEDCLIIEIVTDDIDIHKYNIKAIAAEIKQINKQDSVLIQSLHNTQELI